MGSQSENLASFRMRRKASRLAAFLAKKNGFVCFDSFVGFVI